MAAFEWPDDIPVSTTGAQLRSISVEGMPSLDGNDPVNVGPGQVWATSINLVVTKRDGVLLKYRQLEILFDGRINPCIFPFNEGIGPGYVAGLTQAIPFSDGSLFDDDTGWSETYGAIVLTQQAQRSSTRVLIKVPDDVKIEVGQKFSLPDFRMHAVREIVSFANGVYALNVRPILRNTYPAGTVTEFERPVCLMVKQTDNTGKLDLSFFQNGTPTLDLVEPKGTE